MINSAALIGQPASVPLQLLRLPRTRLKVGRHSGCLCVRVACLVWPPSRLVRACAAPTVHKSATNGESFSTVDIKLVRGSPFPSTCVACKTSLSTWAPHGLWIGEEKPKSWSHWATRMRFLLIFPFFFSSLPCSRNQCSGSSSSPPKCGFWWIRATWSPSRLEQVSLFFLFFETSWRWGRTVGRRHTMCWWQEWRATSPLLPSLLRRPLRPRRFAFARAPGRPLGQGDNKREPDVVDSFWLEASTALRGLHWLKFHTVFFWRVASLTFWPILQHLVVGAIACRFGAC